LREVSEYELRVRLQDADFESHARGVLGNFNAYLNEKNTWGHHHAPQLHKIRSRISPLSLVSTNRCPFPRAAWASWPATTQNPPAIWAWVSSA
jgi:hypothetical protein